MASSESHAPGLGSCHQQPWGNVDAFGLGTFGIGTGPEVKGVIYMGINKGLFTMELCLTMSMISCTRVFSEDCDVFNLLSALFISTNRVFSFEPYSWFLFWFYFCFIFVIFF